MIVGLVALQFYVPIAFAAGSYLRTKPNERFFRVFDNRNDSFSRKSIRQTHDTDRTSSVNQHKIMGIGLQRLCFIVTVVPNSWIKILAQRKAIKQYNGGNGFKHKKE